MALGDPEPPQTWPINWPQMGGFSVASVKIEPPPEAQVAMDRLKEVFEVYTEADGQVEWGAWYGRPIELTVRVSLAKVQKLITDGKL